MASRVAWLPALAKLHDTDTRWHPISSATPENQHRCFWTVWNALRRVTTNRVAWTTKLMEALDPRNPRFISDPYPIFEALRLQDPIHWSPNMKAWVITRHNDVKLLAAGIPQTSAERFAPVLKRRIESQAPNTMRYLNAWMSFRDPPLHTRLRKILAKAFTPRAIDALAPLVRESVDLLLDELEAELRSRQMADFISAFAYRLPALVIMGMLGVPSSEIASIKRWSDGVGLVIGTALTTERKYEQAEESVSELAAFLLQLIRNRRAAPSNDLISHLASQGDDEERMTDDELVGTLMMFLYAGHETTTSLIAKGLYHSNRDRHAWQGLLDGLFTPECAVEEWLRYDSPVAAIARYVIEDFEWRDKRLRRGDRIFGFLNAANRDPEVFEQPDRLDLARTPNPHIAFGGGPHFCIGAGLARMETHFALTSLLERLPDIRFVDDQLKWKDSLIMRGVVEMRVTLPT